MTRFLAALPQQRAERLCLSGNFSILKSRLSLGSFKTEAQPRASGPEATGKAEPYRTLLRQSRGCFFACTVVLGLILAACNHPERRSSIPSDAQAVLDMAIEDLNAERYDKLYGEAADEWRRDTTADESRKTFERLREKLGRASVRNLQTAREEQTGTAPVAGHSLIAVYQTSFEQGHAIETFTLVERGGKWYLAKYFVSSTAFQ